MIYPSKLARAWLKIENIVMDHTYSMEYREAAAIHYSLLSHDSIWHHEDYEVF